MDSNKGLLLRVKSMMEIKNYNRYNSKATAKQLNAKSIEFFKSFQTTTLQHYNIV